LHTCPNKSTPNPEENKEFQSLYTDPNGGQNKYGGWKKPGRKLFRKYTFMNKNAREQKPEVCAQVETACVARLFEQKKELYEKQPKNRKAKEISSDSENDDDEPLGYN
jgi:hypothetical protein